MWAAWFFLGLMVFHFVITMYEIIRHPEYLFEDKEKK